MFLCAKYYRGRGGRENHGETTSDTRNGKDEGLRARCPSAIIPALWFGIMSDFRYNYRPSRSSVGLTGGIFHTACVTLQTILINSHYSIPQDSSHPIESHEKQRKHQRKGMKQLIDPKWLEMMSNPDSLWPTADILGMNSQNWVVMFFGSQLQLVYIKKK